MSAAFVHLHLHTEYSLADGLIRVDALMDAVAAAGMPAVALTDRSNVFALVKFYRAALARGIKPLVGVDVLLESAQQDMPAGPVVLLCQDEAGYRNLTRLVTRAYLEGQQRGAPMLARAWLAEANEGLIALSGGREGALGRALLAGRPEGARRELELWQQHFPHRFYHELQRTGRPDEEAYVRAAVELASETATPVVATNDVRFLRREDFEAHEARVCIHDGSTLADPRRARRYSAQQYLRTPAEMASLFADVPEALANTAAIAARCNLGLRFGENVLPEFPVPAGHTTDEHFRAEAHAGLETRLAAHETQAPAGGAASREAYLERLEHELGVITRMQYPGYFLIVADFIRWAKANGVPVGPGRGSGAGSLVAYALGITELDPLKYDLLFERFLNPERVSMPDFDIDFCMEGRDRVIDYVAERFGRERVSQVITYGSMAARAVVRDVGRVLGHPYGFVDRIAKLIPFELAMTLDKALEQEPDLRQAYDSEEDVQAIVDMARSLEGLARNAGKHAGGVVIAPSKLTDFTPLYCEPRGQSVVTQLDKDDVEAIGLVKFDFLGLRTLTIIDRAVRAINAQRGDEPALDIGALALDDRGAFELLKRQQTTAVFQLESRGLKDLLKRLQPDNFEEIIALVALYRPGPLQSGMVEDFVDRKHGRARVDYPHPELEPILKPTYGVILYQEQVMQIAQVLAGYTLGAADLLRRAMGKKKPAEMAKQRQVFCDGATARGVQPETATYIFDLMEKFAGYGFNKSHSAAYALLAYQTAWLKAHHSAAFMAAVLSADMDNTDKVVNLIDECRSMGLDVTPPDINRSAYAFTVHERGAVVYGLGAIKGVGQAAIEALLEARPSQGYRDLADLCGRMASSKLNRRALEALIRAGALDSLGANRAILMAELADALRTAEQRQRDTSAGQVDLFGGAARTPAAAPSPAPDWDEDTRLAGEKETLGLYLTGHPIARFADELGRFTNKRIGELRADTGETRGPGRETQTVVLGGLVVGLRTRNTQNGRMAFLTLDDRSGRIEVGVFPEEYRKASDCLVRDRILVVEGTAGVDDYTGEARFRARSIMDVDQARERYAKGLRLQLEVGDGEGRQRVHALKDALSAFTSGRCRVQVVYVNGRASAELALGDDWRVQPNEALLQRLRRLDGMEYAELVY